MVIVLAKQKTEQANATKKLVIFDPIVNYHFDPAKIWDKYRRSGPRMPVPGVVSRGNTYAVIKRHK